MRIQVKEIVKNILGIGSINFGLIIFILSKLLNVE